MRELKQDWRDIFGSFRVAFDVWKLMLSFAGVILTGLLLWGLRSLPMDGDITQAGWITALIVCAILLIGLFAKFASSETGFTASKLVMLLAAAVFLAGLVLLCFFTPKANWWGYWGGLAVLVLAIWAFFGGAITRIAAIEIASDDRIGLGEAAGFACRKYGAYLGATILPAVAVLFLALCCALFGLASWIPYGCVAVVLLFFFLVPIAGFLMFLIGLGGMAGGPLMFPAVSAEGNDSFDAISRAYSYVFGRPWRYLFYNLCAAVYGAVCSLFIGMFVYFMLAWSLTCVDYGRNNTFNTDILPKVKDLLSPLTGPLSACAADVLDVIQRLTGAVITIPGLADVTKGNDAPGWPETACAVIIAIFVYVILGLVVAYVISLFFSLQTTIYLLLRKSVDGADMTEVYREEDQDAFAATAGGEAGKTVEEKKE